MLLLLSPNASPESAQSFHVHYATLPLRGHIMEYCCPSVRPFVCPGRAHMSRTESRRKFKFYVVAGNISRPTWKWQYTVFRQKGQRSR